MKTAKSIVSLWVAAAVMLTGMFVSIAAYAQASKKEQEQQAVRKAASQTLTQLYKVQPNAEKAIAGAAGYAVFSNFGMKILAVGGGSGSGLAVSNETTKKPS